MMSGLFALSIANLVLFNNCSPYSTTLSNANLGQQLAQTAPTQTQTQTPTGTVGSGSTTPPAQSPPTSSPSQPPAVTTLPTQTAFKYASEIYSNPSPWGSTDGLSIASLFSSFDVFFSNAGDMVAAKSSSQAFTSQGIIPSAVSQRWETTYMASMAAKVGEPSWITSDRANNGSPFTSRPEYQAWISWTNSHLQYIDTAFDGGSMPTYWRPGASGYPGSNGWVGNWGHISPMMPLNASDCPPGISPCTYGDWYAYQWAQTSKLTGAYGWVGSDFSNMLPAQASFIHDFNPRIMAAFAASIHQTIPGSTPAAQAAYIVNNLYPQWNDFLAMGYAQFFASLNQQITAATGHQALVIAGAADYPGESRTYAVDERMMAQIPGQQNFLMVLADTITMQTDRSGQPMIWGIGSNVVNCAREPDVRNGSYLSADDTQDFWPAVAQFYPTLSATSQKEWGAKQLKRQWLETVWAHIATRQGYTRRGLTFALRDHWEWGTVDATTEGLIKSIIPTKPFGFAVYYSVAVERSFESAIPSGSDAYLDPDDILNLKQTLPVNYFVSDAGLANLQPSAVPAAWIVLDTGNRLPASELAQLQAFAPVFTSVAQAQSFAGAPLSFSGGLTGTGFYDQNNRLIVTVSNPSVAAAAVAISGTMKLLVPSGSYTMTDLYSGAATQFNSVGGVAQVPVSVSRWDTLAYSIVKN